MIKSTIELKLSYRFRPILKFDSSAFGDRVLGFCFKSSDLLLNSWDLPVAFTEETATGIPQFPSVPVSNYVVLPAQHRKQVRGEQQSQKSAESSRHEGSVVGILDGNRPHNID